MRILLSLMIVSYSYDLEDLDKLCCDSDDIYKNFLNEKKPAKPFFKVKNHKKIKKAIKPNIKSNKAIIFIFTAISIYIYLYMRSSVPFTNVIEYVNI